MCSRRVENQGSLCLRANISIIVAMPDDNRFLRRLDLTTLQIFVAIAQEKTLTRAAERESIAVSAASRRLVELERFLEVELFVRHAKGMELTEVGRSLLAHSQRMLLNAATMNAELREYQQGIRGYVTLLANLSAIVAFLPDDLEPFFLAHPELRIELEERPTDRVVQGVLEGVADIGICSSDADLKGLRSEIYRRDRLVVTMRADHPLADAAELSFAETLDYEQIGLHAQSSIYTRSQIAAREAARPFRRRIHVPGFDAVCRTVRANLGIALIPEPVFEILGRSMGLRAVRLSDAWAARDIVLLTRPGDALSAGATLLRDHLLAAPG
ncbi:MAG: LysR family transcriptional regulator [Sphingomonas bacterium]|jgi:DNA-binding transcriptional LysR family regulator|nr:LysR family transcriptional regulator [Sphingomonas bacterium]